MSLRKSGARKAEDGVGASFPGCAGMADLVARFWSKHGLRVIDGVSAATTLARALALPVLWSFCAGWHPQRRQYPAGCCHRNFACCVRQGAQRASSNCRTLPFPLLKNEPEITRLAAMLMLRLRRADLSYTCLNVDGEGFPMRAAARGRSVAHGRPALGNLPRRKPRGLGAVYGERALRVVAGVGLGRGPCPFFASAKAVSGHRRSGNGRHGWGFLPGRRVVVGGQDTRDRPVLPWLEPA